MINLTLIIFYKKIIQPHHAHIHCTNRPFPSLSPASPQDRGRGWKTAVAPRTTCMTTHRPYPRGSTMPRPNSATCTHSSISPAPAKPAHLSAAARTCTSFCRGIRRWAWFFFRELRAVFFYFVYFCLW